jgi:hypothetical protein
VRGGGGEGGEVGGARGVAWGGARGVAVSWVRGGARGWAPSAAPVQHAVACVLTDSSAFVSYSRKKLSIRVAEPELRS